MLEYLVQHKNLIEGKWVNVDRFFEQTSAIRIVGGLHKDFPDEKFRILKCEILEQQP